MRVAVGTSARNEKHIIEWLTYYLKIGVDYFVIYDDLSDIPIQNIFDECNVDKSKYTIFRNTDTLNLYENLNERYIVHKCYSYTCWSTMFVPKLIEQNIDYLLYVDLDEFLYINSYSNIKQLIEYYEPFDVLKINWLMFGSNNLITNDGTNNIIDVFTKSCDKLWVSTGSLKSITKISSISLNNEYQYGPHVLPVIPNCIVKDKNNQILESYNNNLNHVTPITGGTDYKNTIYIAHYSCQDLTTFFRRKFCNKTNYYWWINYLNVPHRKDVYTYIELINANFNDFIYYLNEVINKQNRSIPLPKQIKLIPQIYIDKMIQMYNMFNTNIVDNFDISTFKHKK